MLGLIWISGRTSYSKILWRVGAMRLRFRLFQSLRNWATILAALLLSHLLDCKAISSFWHPVSQLQDFVRSHDKTSYSLVDRGPGSCFSQTLYLKSSWASKDFNWIFFTPHCSINPPSMRSSWSYSRENGPLRSNTSTSSSHHAKMWGVDYAIFGIIENAISCSITRWNVTIFWRADFVSYHFKSKSCFFINIYFHQTQSDRANRYHWTLPPLKNIVPYFICFASIIKAKEAFFNKTNEIISYNMYTVAMDTTTKPF